MANFEFSPGAIFRIGKAMHRWIQYLEHRQRRVREAIDVCRNSLVLLERELQDIDDIVVEFRAVGEGLGIEL